LVTILLGRHAARAALTGFVSFVSLGQQILFYSHTYQTDRRWRTPLRIAAFLTTPRQHGIQE
jgi:hypothetical protein